MSKMILIRGLPGSGKSTFAKELAETENAVILSTDDIISANNYYIFSPDYLGLAHTLNQAKAEEYCKRGRNIIIDNTNITTREVQPYFDIANKYKYEFELQEMNLEWSWNIDECFKRNRHSVPLEVIKRMKNRYQSNHKVIQNLKVTKQHTIQPVKFEADLPDCIICDIDGTLAELGDRSPYDTAKCESDKLNWAVYIILYKFCYDKDNPYTIILMSGREEKFRPETERWLKYHNVPYHRLFMRATGDNRRDSVVKHELFENHVRNVYNPIFVLDDRFQVQLECWKPLGLWVFNCNQNLEKF